MQLSTIQAKVYAGYAKAAQFVGSSYAVLRASGANNPLAGSPVATLMAQLTPHGQNQFGFNKPSDFKSPMFHAMLDGSQINIGDYLQGAQLYFVAGLDSLQPPLAILCNGTFSLYERPETSGEGVKNYGGDEAATNTALALNWPCSALMGSRAVTGQTLPGDAGFGTFEFKLPSTFPVTILPAMIIVDGLGARYIVQVAEKTSYAWRVTAKAGIV